MEYEELLEQAYKKVKPLEDNKERFEIPKARSIIEGNKTILANFSHICSYLRRNCEHLEKFLEKELAAPGKIEGERLTLVKKIPSKKIDEKIEDYAKTYVVCRQCGKPDTQIIKQGEFSFIHCLACGAKHSISKI
jgi:translation initiation factor 2 subunit 2